MDRLLAYIKQRLWLSATLPPVSIVHGLVLFFLFPFFRGGGGKLWLTKVISWKPYREVKSLKLELKGLIRLLESKKKKKDKQKNVSKKLLTDLNEPQKHHRLQWA